MWKVNLGFVFALVALGLGGYGAYNNVEELLGIATGHDEKGKERQDTAARLLTLRERARSGQRR